MHPFKKILIGLGLYQGNMSSSPTPEFHENNVFSHRYRRPEVLKPFLKRLGFKEEGPDDVRFKIHTFGDTLKVQLPNQRLLSKEEREEVHQLFEKAHADAQKKAQSKQLEAEKNGKKTKPKSKKFAGKGGM